MKISTAKLKQLIREELGTVSIGGANSNLGVLNSSHISAESRPGLIGRMANPDFDEDESFFDGLDVPILYLNVGTMGGPKALEHGIDFKGWKYFARPLNANNRDRGSHFIISEVDPEQPLLVGNMGVSVNNPDAYAGQFEFVDNIRKE